MKRPPLCPFQRTKRPFSLISCYRISGTKDPVLFWKEKLRGNERCPFLLLQWMGIQCNHIPRRTDESWLRRNRLDTPVFLSTVRHSCTTLGQNRRWLWEQTDFHLTVGQCLVSDENSICWRSITYNTPFDGDVKICLSYDSVWQWLEGLQAVDGHVIWGSGCSSALLSSPGARLSGSESGIWASSPLNKDDQYHRPVCWIAFGRLCS